MRKHARVVVTAYVSMGMSVQSCPALSRTAVLAAYEIVHKLTREVTF